MILIFVELFVFERRCDIKLYSLTYPETVGMLLVDRIVVVRSNIIEHVWCILKPSYSVSDSVLGQRTAHLYAKFDTLNLNAVCSFSINIPDNDTLSSVLCLYNCENFCISGCSYFIIVKRISAQAIKMIRMKCFCSCS